MYGEFVRLPPDSGSPAPAKDWPLVGGHLVLDLLNTVSWRLDPHRHVDYLTHVDALTDWLRTIDRGHADAAQREPMATREQAVRDVRELRDATATVLDALVMGDTAPLASLDVLVRLGTQAVAASSLHPDLPSRWVCPVDGPADLVHHLALATITLLQGDRARRIRRCEGPGCGWFFLDTTRNHSRRWCAAGDCGNRVRVRNYVQRRRVRPKAQPDGNSSTTPTPLGWPG